MTAIAVGTAPRTEEARLDSASGTCTGEDCTAGIALYAFAPETAVVTIEELGQRVRHVAVPQYQLNYPSGPHCGGAARIGRVTYAAP